MKFHIASPELIKEGLTTDVYFERTEKILKAKKLDRVRAVAEVTAKKLPKNWKWGVVCGVEEALYLLEGLPVDVYAMREGTIFHARDNSGNPEPVLFVEGPYASFCRYETPLLGLLCQSSGVATTAARLRKLVGDKLLLSFGARRMHPAISPMIERAAYIGGVDGVSTLLAAKLIGKHPMGTMPHALILIIGDQKEAWRVFDEVIDENVPRIALVDTNYDEKVESLMAAEVLGEKLHGVRLDTPSSRKGDFADIIREVRWELNIRGYEHVKIIVSGGIDESNITELSEAGADGFGVGTSLSNAPTIDFAFDIVEVSGEPKAKRGKLSGKKQVWRCEDCFIDVVKPFGTQYPTCQKCGKETRPLLEQVMSDGKIVCRLKSPSEIRQYVLSQLSKVEI